MHKKRNNLIACPKHDSAAHRLNCTINSRVQTRNDKPLHKAAPVHPSTCLHGTCVHGTPWECAYCSSCVRRTQRLLSTHAYCTGAIVGITGAIAVSKHESGPPPALPVTHLQRDAATAAHQHPREQLGAAAGQEPA